MFSFCSRRMGVELEYNSFDRLSRSSSENNLPNGIYVFGDIIKNTLGKSVDINKWHQTNNNDHWIVKPDSSCGLEVCSPPDQPYHALLEIRKVIEGLLSHKSIAADDRCSLHLHVEVEDFDEKDLCALVARWIQFEHFFFFLTKKNRWLNRYCKPLGFYYEFDDSCRVTIKKCMEILSENKYFAINFFHYKKEKRKTVEFRIMGNDACMDVDDAINWCKLILCFVERCKKLNYESTFIGDISYANIDQVNKFLNIHDFFDEDDVILWVISRLNETLNEHLHDGNIWKQIIQYCKPSIRNLIEELQGKI
jgi:hypothetical protein